MRYFYNKMILELISARREMRPEFARAARELKKFGMNLGKVDAAAEVSLEEEFGVKARRHFSPNGL